MLKCVKMPLKKQTGNTDSENICKMKNAQNHNMKNKKKQKGGGHTHTYVTLRTRVNADFSYIYSTRAIVRPRLVLQMLNPSAYPHPLSSLTDGSGPRVLWHSPLFTIKATLLLSNTESKETRHSAALNRLKSQYSVLAWFVDCLREPRTSL